MKTLCWLWGLVAALAIGVKLFTFEFVLRDDPTIGVALRAVPSLISQRTMVHSPDSHIILVQDENEFVGGEEYRRLVSWGWIVLAAAWPVLLIASRRRSSTAEG